MSKFSVLKNNILLCVSFLSHNIFIFTDITHNTFQHRYIFLEMYIILTDSNDLHNVYIFFFLLSVHTHNSFFFFIHLISSHSYYCFFAFHSGKKISAIQVMCHLGRTHVVIGTHINNSTIP